MDVTFKILPQESLIIEKYTGDFDFDDYQEMKTEEYSNPDFCPNFNILIDLRNASSREHTPPDIIAKTIADFLKKNSEKIGKRKTAFLTSEPFQVVNSILYSDIAKTELPITVNRFSTIEAAIDWLGIINRGMVIKELE